MKAWLPAGACMLGLLTCLAALVLRKPPGVEYNVEIVVHGPDGKVIPAVRRAPRPGLP